jgi:hypothetical protein
MARYCLLDVLPVEIFHVLFTNFLAYEILLTLSDDIDTPGQSELFFRRFRIE